MGQNPKQLVSNTKESGSIVCRHASHQICVVLRNPIFAQDHGVCVRIIAGQPPAMASEAPQVTDLHRQGSRIVIQVPGPLEICLIGQLPEPESCSVKACTSVVVESPSRFQSAVQERREVQTRNCRATLRPFNLKPISTMPRKINIWVGIPQKTRGIVLHQPSGALSFRFPWLCRFVRWRDSWI